jgi:hypothetical protein
MSLPGASGGRSGENGGTKRYKLKRHFLSDGTNIHGESAGIESPQWIENIELAGSTMF